MSKDYLAQYRDEPKDILHFGVKGMKWGVRRDSKTGIRPIAKTLNDSRFGKKSIARAEAHGQKVNAKLDKKFEKSFSGTKGYIKVHNAVADELNARVPESNNRPKYAGKNLYQDKKLHDAYWKDVDKMYDQAYSAAATKLGISGSGNKKVVIERQGFGKDATWRMGIDDIKHADLGSNLAVFVAVVDDNGQLVELKLKDDLAHSELMHFGVKGMKWGVRNDSRGSRSSKKASVENLLTHPGGESSPERYDRISKVAKAGQAKALTDDDLRFYNARSAAIRQVEAMNQRNPSWFEKSGKSVLQKTVMTAAAGVAAGVTSHYVTKPLVAALTGAAAKKAGQKVAKEVVKNPIGFTLPK